jgi:hypothetical protein
VGSFGPPKVDRMFAHQRIVCLMSFGLLSLIPLLKPLWRRVGVDHGGFITRICLCFQFFQYVLLGNSVS